MSLDEEERAFYDAIKQRGKIRKLANKYSSTEILRVRKVKFESKNNGVHLIVTGKDAIIDFWPSTGKFIVRGEDGKIGRGVFNLLKHCKVE